MSISCSLQISSPVIWETIRIALRKSSEISENRCRILSRSSKIGYKIVGVKWFRRLQYLYGSFANNWKFLKISRIITSRFKSVANRLSIIRNHLKIFQNGCKLFLIWLQIVSIWFKIVSNSLKNGINNLLTLLNENIILDTIMQLKSFKYEWLQK